MQWQPIGTAPKNGKHVLLFCKSADVKITGGYWDKKYKCWIAGGYMRKEMPPTFWMPLPDEPSNETRQPMP